MDHPTRKVDSMSSLVAEMLLRDSDSDSRADADATSSAARDAVGLDMARLIEVRSSVAPSRPPPPSPPMPAKSHTAVWLLAAVVFLAALAGAAFALSR